MRNGCALGILGTFFLAWHIFGTVIVFQMKDCDTTGNVSRHCFSTTSILLPYCNAQLYWYTYGDIIAKWIIIGLAAIGGVIYLITVKLLRD
ncbi:hypothetical protein EB796_006522 [Bugula neritina]|uniref:Uncharacterized protein n=1 Tax=Bugula neritina TaxID=10212 RepID=A0A7J7KAC5_BUGNE|nr:hypothetical protein EB796_006522 [Bugula neritina]